MSKELAAEHRDGDQDDRGAASEDSDGGNGPFGPRALQLLALLRANFPIRGINGYDWELGRCTYRQRPARGGSTRGRNGRFGPHWTP